MHVARSRDDLADFKVVHISWYKRHRRSEEVAEAVGAEVFFVRSLRSSTTRKYISQWRETRRILRARQPHAVIVMQPPVFALLCVMMHAPSRRTVLIGDLHSGSFQDPKWKWARPLLARILGRRGFAIVPNGEIAETAREYGLAAYILPAVISDRTRTTGQGASMKALVPLTYSFDEPVDAILEAAAMLPDVEWILTGNPSAEVRTAAPANVRFPGWVSDAEYEELLAHVDVVCALTSEEGTMQSAGFEAISRSVPLVTSPRRVLMDYFDDAARYAENEPAAIADAVSDVISNSGLWSKRMQQRMTEVMDAQHDSIRTVRVALANRLKGL